jgi:hypothetical protein
MDENKFNIDSNARTNVYSEIDLLKKSIISQNKIITQLEDQQKLLLNKTIVLQESKEKIDYYQNSLISSFGTIYTIITIAIALLTVGLPLVTWFFGIKPSQDAVRDLEKNLNQKVSDHLRQTKIDQINNALKIIKNQPSTLSQTAFQFLSLSRLEGLSDNQLLDIYTLLKTKNYQEHEIRILTSLLASKRNSFAEDLFCDERFAGFISFEGFDYFTKFDYANDLSILKKFINASGNPTDSYFTILSNLKKNSKIRFVEMLNNEEFINSIPDYVIKNYKNKEGDYYKNFENLIKDDPTCNNTLLYKKILLQ